MNNLTIGGVFSGPQVSTANSVRSSTRATPSVEPVETRFAYYETIGGGMGAGALGGGLSGVQTHMTNTLNTPIEALEMRFPLRIARYGIRRGSGGTGRRSGGDGVVREFEFLTPARVTLLTERRTHRPWGLAGGGDGAVGENLLNGRPLPGKISFAVQPGDRLTVRTPGGGGYGRADHPDAGPRAPSGAD
jgi:N-methylhydantoinase B